MDQSDPRSEAVTPGTVEKAARQFASDIRTLRERRNIPLVEVHRKTRISKGILAEFESSGLVANQLFNRVYLRSLVIAYAQTIGIDRARILDALEAVLSGTYEGDLVQDVEDGASDATADVGTAGSPPSSQEAPEADGAPLIEEEKESERDGKAARVAHRFQFEEYPGRSAGGQERVHTEISTAVHNFVPPEEHRGLIVQPNRFRTVGLTSIVAIFSVSAILLALRLSSSSGPAATSEVEPQSISEREVVAPRPPDPVPVLSPIVLGDSVSITVVASSGPLDPIRVQIDRDLRRPYWVDEGDSMTFKMARRIAIQDLLDRISLRVEGVPFPLERFAGAERIVIDRDTLRSFVGSQASR